MMHHNTKFGNKMPGGLEDIWTNINILTLHCDLDPECSNPSFFSTGHSSLWWCIIRPKWLPRNQQFRKYRKKSHIMIIWALTVTLTLKIATTTTFSHMALWLMMLHDHTKFGNKMFCDSENIIPTVTHILNLHCDLALERSNPIFQQDTLAYDAVLSNQVWLQTNQQFRWYSRNNHILII